METCAWCNAPRGDGPKCPSCGADYAKAEQIRRQGKAVAAVPQAIAVEAPAPAALVGLEDREVEDPKLELQITVIAPPAMLALAIVFQLLLPSLQRIFLSMPVHELGHAATAWLCGFPAIPTFWQTRVWEGRSLLMTLALAGTVIYLMVLARRAGKPLFLALGAALLLAQAIATFGIRERTAQMLIAFGGYGMGMVLGLALMASFFFGKRTELYKGWLRWGFLVIGAAAFADMFSTWWMAQWNPDVIPFGENEGSGLSDPLKLLEEHRWPTKTIVRRYVLVGCAALAGLVLVYAWGVLRARRRAQKPSNPSPASSIA